MTHVGTSPSEDIEEQPGGDIYIQQEEQCINLILDPLQKYPIIQNHCRPSIYIHLHEQAQKTNST